MGGFWMTRQNENLFSTFALLTGQRQNPSAVFFDGFVAEPPLCSYLAQVKPGSTDYMSGFSRLSNK
jgi:hypothetical protein